MSHAIWFSLNEISSLGKSRDRKPISGFQVLEEEEEWEWLLKWYRVFFWGDETVLELVIMVIETTSAGKEVEKLEQLYTVGWNVK